MTEMGGVDHTHPHTGEPFEITYRRGVVLAADGGRPGEETAPEETDEADAEMADVEHESPNEGTSRSFERGREGREDSV